jgi:uncharacterized repeat protein (TIGR01451 family)
MRRPCQNLLIAVSLSAGGLCAMTLPVGIGSSDWSSITKEYQRHRHAAFPIDGGGYKARGWEQQWLTRFDGRGFEVIPDEGSWRWGLQLKSYGFRGAERDVAKHAQVSTDVERISYRWTDGLEEWFVNRADGLEQGFTITKRPPGAGPLSVRLAVRGNLRGEGSGRAVRFVDGAGAAVVNYEGLRAIDSTGREITARMTIEAGGLRIEVNESGARYPITIDPLVQQAYIKASNSRQFLGFGASVAIDGDTVVVGTDNESSNATGVNGDQTNTSLAQAGAVYVFVRNGTTWTQQAYLKPINTQGGERFGHSVAISGDSIVVGAFWEGSITKGVNPDPTPVVPHPAPFSGAAYTFVRVAGSWFTEAYIKASNTKSTIGGGDNFGNSVAISGDLMAIGAPNESSNTVGIDHDQTNTQQPLAGAVYLFIRTAGVWAQAAYVKGPVAKSQQFGWSVAASGNTVVVGAPLENSGSSGIAGDELDTSAPGSGAAYVYASAGGVWGLQGYLKASNTDAQDQFGWSVAVSGDTVAVGAIGEDSNATGINGDQTNNLLSNSGAAYVFTRTGTLWSQQAYMKPSPTLANAQFGSAIALDGDTLVAGAPKYFSGQGYVFARTGTTWSQQALLFPSNAATNFSTAVAVSGSTIVATGLDSSNATGVNGNPSNTSAPNSGAAYVFVPPAPPDVTINLQHADPFTLGQPGLYTITIANTGGVATSGNITVTDPMVTGMTLETGTIVAANWDCTASTSANLSCTFSGSLPPAGGSSTIQFHVDLTAAGGYVLTNVATVAGGGDTDTSNDTATDITTISGVSKPDLTITKTHVGDFFDSSSGTFTVRVTNSGAGALPVGAVAGVTVQELAPTWFQVLTMSGSGWSCTPPLCVRSDTLAAGASYPDIAVVVEVRPGAPASVTNNVSVSTNAQETNTNNNSATDTVTIDQRPDLMITKTHIGNFVQGGTGTFTLMVSNIGVGAVTAGQTVRVTDFPATNSGMIVTAMAGAGWSCSQPFGGLNNGCVRTDALTAGVSYPAITVTVSVPTVGVSVINNASVTGVATDANVANNLAQDAVTIVPPLRPDLTITKTHTGSFVQGGAGTFLLHVSNIGHADVAANSSVRVNEFPGPTSGLTVTSMTGTGWACLPPFDSPSGGCVRNDTLAAGASYPLITVTVSIAPNAPASALNIANVSEQALEESSVNNTVTDVVVIMPPLRPDLDITISHSGNFVQGETGIFAIFLSNIGQAAVPAGTPITVFDTPDVSGALTLTAMSGNGWSCTPSLPSYKCVRNDALAAGASYPSIIATVSVAGNAPPAVTNTANVIPIVSEESTVNNVAEDLVIIGPKPVPSLSWSNPANILVGTPLGSGQLSATASVPGTFAYTPGPGTVLQVGNGQTLSVLFTPTDSITYASAKATAAINVLPVPGSPVKIITTSALDRSGINDISVQLTLTNIGGTIASNVVLTSVKIGSTSGTSLPQAIGAIGSDASVIALVTVPGSAGASGSPSVLIITGTYSGGSFSATSRITLP